MRKARELLRAGARVTAVAPEFKAPAGRPRGAAGWARLKGVKMLRKKYSAADARGCAVVVAAVDDEALNRRIARDARRGGALVNVVDAPELCDFIVPSVLRRGELTIAVSTGGASPMLAKKIRKDLEKRFPARYSAFVRLMGEARRMVMESTPPGKERREALRRIIYGRVENIFMRDGAGAAMKHVREILSKY